jgi:predicted chitinase
MADLGIHERENKIINESDKVLRKLHKLSSDGDKRLELFLEHNRKAYNLNGNKNKNAPHNKLMERSKDLIKDLRQAFLIIHKHLRDIVLDHNIYTIEDNERTKNTLAKKLKSPVFKELFLLYADHMKDKGNLNNSPLVNNTKDKLMVKRFLYDVKHIDHELDDAFGLVYGYISYKKSLLPTGALTNAHHKMDHSIQELKYKTGFGKGQTKQLGKLGVAGLSFAAGAFFKSPGLAVPAVALMASRKKKNESQLEQYLKTNNQIRTIGNDLESSLQKYHQKKYWGDMDHSLSRFAGGTGKFRTAKRDGEVILGDNSGGREAWGMVTKKGQKIGGVTSGPSKIGVSKGSKLFARPLSGGGHTSVDPSQFGGGTGEGVMDSGESLLIQIEKRELTILEKMYHSNAAFYKDQLSRMDDAANREDGPTPTAVNGIGTNASLQKKIKEKGIIGGLMDHVNEYLKGAVMAYVIANAAAITSGLVAAAGVAATIATGVGVVLAGAAVTVAGMALVNYLMEKSGLNQKLQDQENKDLTAKQQEVKRIQEIRRTKGDAAANKITKQKEDEKAAKSYGGQAITAEDKWADINAIKKIQLDGKAAGKTPDQIKQEIKDYNTTTRQKRMEAVGQGATNGSVAQTRNGKGIASSPQSGQRGKDLEQAAIANGIKDPRELASFMGQMSHETGGFSKMKEDDHTPESVMRLRGSQLAKYGIGEKEIRQQYASGGSAAMGELMYADKYREAGYKMGNTKQGDGEKYKGRGFVQLTGKDQYAEYGKALGIDLINKPELAEDPVIAQKIAVLYWQKKDLGSKARAGNNYAVTQAINGGQNGAADRENRTQAYLNDYNKNGVPTATNSMVANKNAIDKASPTAVNGNSPVAQRDVAGKKMAMPTNGPAASNRTLASGTPVAPVNKINTYNSKVQNSDVEIAQAKADANNVTNNNKKQDVAVNNNTVVNNSGGGAAPKGGNPNVTTGDDSWVSLLTKGYSI